MEQLLAVITMLGAIPLGVFIIVGTVSLAHWLRGNRAPVRAKVVRPSDYGSVVYHDVTDRSNL